MQDLEFLKLLKIAKKFFEEVYDSHVQVIIVYDQRIKPQVGDVILRPTKEDCSRILRRLKFEKDLEDIKKEKEKVFGIANTGGGFGSYS
ncbi:hypothetical protein [Archaeoglobus profundus]|uniref:Uncharacterized protein n=1 Tax=Archaeoglobus profundus (strain DSM 5631 / JCM 9629 / NBRC 100127 / Av18) TaxID=572546 RepID=D2REK2_ARCPA|nr:hypothetical protein [Archaeoglobus profundus]ADB58546.1 hypothetical protein Arcpr_1500 [Archaeoglobus profundus DSM 5631]